MCVLLFVVLLYDILIHLNGCPGFRSIVKDTIFMTTISYSLTPT
jgi:hypothetical protein